MSRANRIRRSVRGMAARKRAIRRARKLIPFKRGPRFVWSRTSGEYPDSAVLVQRAAAKRARRNERRLITWTGRR